MVAIETRYIGPTNYRGSRVVATVCEPRSQDYPIRRKIMSWDDALGSEENHRSAARVLIAELGWTKANGYGEWAVGASERGYVFVNVGRNGSDRLSL